MKKIGVLLADGFEEGEALFTVDVLRRAGMDARMVGTQGRKQVKGAHGVEVTADQLLNGDVKKFDMIVMPGGMPGATNLRDNPEVIALVQEFVREDKYVAAICAAPMVLAKAGVSRGRKVTSYPGFEDLFTDAEYLQDPVVQDGHMITSRGPATVLPFAYRLVEALGGSSESLKEGMLFNMMNKEIAAHGGKY